MIQKNIKNPFLLVGGLAMKSNELHDLANRLNKISQISTLGFDNINVGIGPRIDLKVKELSIFDQAVYQWDQIDREIKNLNQKISIFGISMGGMIAATMAYLRPERIDKLILAATSANLLNLPAVPDSLYNKWMQSKTVEEVWDALTIAFGKTTFKKLPHVPKEYFIYRTAGLNGQNKKEFASQVNSIRSFDGEKVYNNLTSSNLSITILSGDEDILFNDQHVTSIISKVPNAKTFELLNTGHMLHLENPEALTKKLFQILSNS